MSVRTVTLQEVCRIIQGGRTGLSGNDFVPEGFPAYGAGGLNGFLPTYEFDEPAVVLSAIGARCGKCFYAEGKWHSLANTQLIFPDLERVDPKFLWYQLNDERRWHRSGTGQPFIKPADVKSHRIYLPPLPEQRRIAAILDQADALRIKRRAAIKKLDELTQSIFLDMFGDPATNPKGWPRCAIGELTDEVSNWNPSSYPDVEFVYIDIAAVDQLQKCITGARRMIGRDAPSRARQVVRANDVIVSTVRPNLNATAVVPTQDDGAIASTGFCVLRPREGQITSAYLFALVRSNAFVSAMVRQATGASYPAVTDAIILAWPAPRPPIELQIEFSKRVACIETAKRRMLSCNDYLDTLFASLQHRAFRGEL